MILRLKHSTGIVLAAWRALSECHHIYDPKFKILRYVMHPEIRITGLSFSESSLQSGGVQGSWLANFDMNWPARLSLAYWPGRQSLEYCWSILDNFFLNLRCTCLRTYNVHCDAYIFKIYFVSVFLDSGRKAWVTWILIKHTTGGFLILKLLLCTGGVTAKEHTGPRHSF